MRVFRTLLLVCTMSQAMLVWSQMTTGMGTTMVVDEGTNLRVDGSWTWNVAAGASVVNNGLIELSPDAAFNEVIGFPVSGTGIERTEVMYSTALATEEPGGFGLRITTPATLGSTVVERGHVPFTDYSGHTSIARWYRVEPTTNTGLDASIELGYDPLELNGLAEASLIPHIRYTVDIWYPLAGVVNTGSHLIAISGLDTLGTFTAFDEDLPNMIAGASSDALAYLWPNVGPHIELVFTAAAHAGPVRVVDARGAVVRELDAVASSMRIDLRAEDLSSGVYLVHLGSGRPLRFTR